MGSFDWQCPHCGYLNEHEIMTTRKICENCGRETAHELPDEDDKQENPGYY